MSKAKTEFDRWLRGDQEVSPKVFGAASRDSHTIEMIMEHNLLTLIMQECFFGRRVPIAVLRAEIDSEGYDLVLEAGEDVRYVQLKSTLEPGTDHIDVLYKLAEKGKAGCIVWMKYHVDESGWRAKVTYLFREAAKLPEKKGINERKRRLKREADGFLEVTVEELVDCLFPHIGPRKPSQPLQLTPATVVPTPPSTS